MLPSLTVSSASSVDRFLLLSFRRVTGTAKIQWALAHCGFPGQTRFKSHTSSLEIHNSRFKIQNQKSKVQLTGECGGPEGGQIGYRGGRRDS